ncbi:glucosamine--fructose-6-phosphate aminotransferase (isomerizing) [Pullulanibacillus pueri]|uniref:Glutamine--fructose-6-phosphate aminotransferase [isomerizing] n=1 Tax=Pullulanibacillus pueri TaxID=1437324 RepID=A0A8J3EL16_9BACL|nr:glutamine--fructose-6-phosphate transaminase (isomerizing) [Pullulanibacillus pueri]MBM7681313.1 glucosamine--fructose-6-phosphate aminotransferase (isomerizing) [Pullulanibacillus pueri]GGH77631.1 glutamine--fructose-6-phosphate aminotransferase [Pullulanibacillus pueri]
MSGIVGYIGKQPAQPILLDCLKQLDYRGYDSAGLAISNHQRIEVRKEMGRIEDLEASLILEPIAKGTLGIGHTRWASHGTPSALNSHPLSDDKNQFFVVHNGIIENDHQLKRMLTSEGHVFVTETDTEVIPHLLSHYNTGNFEETVQKVIPLLKGAFALAIMSHSEPNTIIAISQENPLILGFGKHEAFLSSDIPALLTYTREIHPIKNGEMAILTPDGTKVKTLLGELLEPKKVFIEMSKEAIHLQDHEHYMLKEIMEQPKAIKRTLDGRLTSEGVILPELDAFFAELDVHRIRKIDIVGSGTSYHSGIIGKKLLDTMLDIPVEVSISSEFSCEHGSLGPGNLVIVLSQSGETADTLSALKEAKRCGCPTIAITNNKRRNIARKADYTLFTSAGPELAVAATKAYTSQISALMLLAIALTEKTNGPGMALIPDLLNALHQLPEDIEKSLIMTQDAIDQFAQVTNDQDHLFLIGRGLDYVLALEGALKLQEVAYLHADAYAAGEMKHGTMALITPGVPVIALATQEKLREKTISNIRELKARDAFVVGITTTGDSDVSDVVDEVLYIPEAHPFLMPILAAIPLQLLAYYAGTVRGYDVDRPRNLAKSLTVE